MKRLLLIDANSLIHRTYHALPPLTNAQGEPTGALYGLASILLKVVNHIRPDYAAALFDRPEPTFRKERFAEYKIHRPKAEEDLVSQIVRARDLFESFSIKTVDRAGYEADDLIGTLAEKFKTKTHITILTGDLDTLQLVENGRVVVETFKKGISETAVYDEEGVVKKLGVHPTQVVDYKALVGDVSDNIPGVRGVGPKTAARFLNQYRSLETLLAQAAHDPSLAKIKQHEDDALLSRELATIVRTVPVNISLDEFVFHPDETSIARYCSKNDFASILKRLSINTTDNGALFNPETTTSVDSPPHLLLLDAELPLPTPALLASSAPKVGFGLKEFFKTHPFSAPYFDVDIARQLLEIPADTWQALSQHIFKKALPKEEFLHVAYTFFSHAIKERGLEKVLYDIELPLLPVVARMEQAGVLVDTQGLAHTAQELGRVVSQKRAALTKEMGRDINPNSPKQLLEYFQKTLKTKITSTAADKLEKIKNRYPVIEKILDYRELFKLKTTYLDAFQRLVADDERIHPTFLQLGAATGRLSCQNPNLQNIPQESEWAPRIRNVFIAPRGWSLVSFDYSQIELRVLASLSQDPVMMKAFEADEDIHRLTAQKIFGVGRENVEYGQRRIAKTLNFGIIYGMGWRAFSQTSGLPAEEAKQFIAKYFEEFGHVKAWQKKIVAQARRDEAVRNANGRLRNVRGINGADARLAAEMERIAINMPLQSLAADILKIAMIKTDEYIQKRWADAARMILSIHDELIFEIKDEVLEKGTESEIVSTIRNIMESAYAIGVPLRAQARIGKRWGEME
jgi:DNA polymerase-1